MTEVERLCGRLVELVASGVSHRRLRHRGEHGTGCLTCELSAEQEADLLEQIIEALGHAERLGDRLIIGP